ncbi:helix-turn-helix transcriptional regulator [Streptomyces sp. NPDC002057]|uniref:helix-turn-helix transcriptional regulator n=1 Tax=Streptomyces sp. NPDC002057 TaxID=3154664 RepID=UPI003330C4CB
MSGATRAATPSRRLYDRAAELSAVARLSARVDAGAGGVLFVTGDTGEGRTSLLARAADDFLRTPSGHGGRIGEGAGDGAAARVGDGATAGVADGAGSRVGCRVAAPSHRGPWSGARALLAALAPTPTAARRALRSARGAHGLGAAVAELLAGRRALICLDDLHLWDAHSRAALAAAWQEPAGRREPGRPPADRPGSGGPGLRRSGGPAFGRPAGSAHPGSGGSTRPGWLVSAARHHRLPDVPGAESVRLGRLTRDGARAFLDDLCTAAPSPRVAGRLFDETAGHPGLLAAVARRLTAAEVAGGVPLPRPVVDGTVLAEVYGGLLDRLPADSRRLLALVALTDRAGDGAGCPAYEVGVEAVRSGARATRTPVEALDGLLADGLLWRRGDVLRFEDPFLARAARASAPVAWLRRVQEAAGTGPSATAAGTRAALARSEDHRADRLGPSPAGRALAPVVRGRSQLVRGLAALAGGPVMDAYEALLQAAELLRERAPVEASDARFLAMEAAWAGGDAAACLAALDGGGDVRGTERDFADGLSAALSVRLDRARPPLARVVARDGAEDDPRLLLRAGSAALVLGDTVAAARVHARALARARAERRTSLLPRVLEHLAYAELRAGRYSRAARTAGEGLRAAEVTGQRNVAAHQHAVLALVGSVVGDERAVVEHAGRALETARPHGLLQAATLAEWALARGELGRGLAPQAAARLVPLVRTGPRGGHFALRMLVVPCFVEAAVAADRRVEARAAAEEYAVWAVQGIDSAAPAQLARCRALLAQGEEPGYWFGEAVRRHDDCANDFERARTLLAYGTWLRRRRRPGDARGPLRDALVTFERAAAEGWAEHARSELRATGGTSGGAVPRVAWGRLTPQQQRIARLVAQGATNREIADRLRLSPRTVDHHLRSVFARLGIRSRVELPGVVGRWDAEGPPVVSGQRDSEGRAAARGEADGDGPARAGGGWESLR